MRLLLDLLLALALLAPVPAFAAAPICDSSCVVCEGAGPGECTTCAEGYYLPSSPGTCALCTDVPHCTGSITCTSASNSQCSGCAPGYYLDGSQQCTSCPTTPHCVEETCSNDIDAVCTACDDGFYAENGTCHACATIEGCVNPITPQCTTGSDSQCNTCGSGRYLNESGQADTCPECAAVPHCSSPLTCTSGTGSHCTFCESGFFLQSSQGGDSCQECAPVDHCTSLTCADSASSTCTACEPGYALVAGTCQVEACTRTDDCSNHGNATGTRPDCTCACDAGFQGASCASPCSAIAFCISSPITCTNAGDSQCTSCAPGHHLVEGATDTCPECTLVPHCTSPLTCTSGTGSHCTGCETGFFLQSSPGGDSCQECAPIDHCASLTCSDSAGSTCTTCEPGYALVAGTCQAEACTRTDDCSNHGNATGTRPACSCACDAGFQGASCASPCSAIAFCISSPITCTNAGDSQCTSCAPGHHLVEGAADTCPADGAITGVPIAGNRARLSDLPKKRETQVVSYDKAIDLMDVDPTVSGATLSIFSTAGGTPFTLALPASQWQGPLPGRRFRFAALGNPRVKILLVNGRLLRITLRGSGAYPLGVAQTEVAASLTIGTTRFCTLFGGTISKDNGVRFVARKAPRPTPTCPVDPADNQAPVAEPNTYEDTANAVGVALGSGSYVVGNVRDDAGPLTDSDPEGDAFSVNTVLSPTLTIAGAPVTLTAVSGGVAAYSFDFVGRTATFTIASNGVVTLTGDPTILFPVLIGEDAVFAFDYTVIDTLGNESNAAHVIVTIHGSQMSCIVFGRC